MQSRRRKFLLLILSLLVLLGLLTFFGDKGILHLLRLEKELVRIREANTKIEEENRKLKEEVKRLQTEKRYIEEIARRELGMIKRRGDHLSIRFFRERKGEFKMKYEGMIYRPPSEADSLILQVTVGCSYNKCTFCGAFQGKAFRLKSFDEIREDIDEVSPYGARIRRVFFADGDALIIPQKDLVRIMTYLRTRLSGLERVGIYANAKDILRKDPAELKTLRDLGLGITLSGAGIGGRGGLKKD